MKKQTLSLSLFALFLFIGISSCGSSRVLSRHRSHIQTQDTVYILAVNDMHATIDRIPRFAFIVDSLRELYPDLILVSAGDNQSGNPINDMHTPKGWPIVRLMNHLSFDVSAVGNHEFDSRPRGFEYLTHHAEFPFISGNFTYPDTLDLRISPWYLRTLSSGLRVGFVSLVEVSQQSGIPSCHPDNVRGFSFTDPIATAPSQLYYADSCDILVYLTHIGYSEDQRLAQLLSSKQVPLIIGGHSHTYVEDNQFHNGILITQAEAKLSYASLITMIVSGGAVTSISSKHITVGSKGACDPETQRIVDEMNDSPFFNEVIATTSTPLAGKEEVAYLMTDALRSMTGADIALVNGGGVRINHLPAGDIRVRDVYSMDPFGNEAITFHMTGHDLYSLCESALHSDSYLYVIPSGMHIRYTQDRDQHIRQIELLTMDNQPLDLDRTYTVSMNSYMPASMVFPKNDQGTNLNVTTAELTVQYLKRLRTLPPFPTKRFSVVVE